MARPWIEGWNPEDETFWAASGQSIARRNLTFSILAEFLGFVVWVLWSVTAARLNDAGFNFTTGQLFTLAAVPALVGATLRIPYTLAVPKFGGRNWTVCSALLLLIPTTLLVAMVSNPDTPYWLFLVGAATAGFGGGNFASSMANISFFYPDKKKGLALGLNAAGGNLGVAVAQLAIPIVITSSAIAVVGGSQMGGALHLQNAGLLWIPFILLAAGCVWLFMDNLSVAKSGFKEQAAIMKRKQTWVMSWLYVGTFGSFIGYSAGLPLLLKSQFPTVTLSIAFLGPLVGSLARPLGGWMADKMGGTRVTFGSFTVMIFAVLGVIFFLSHKTEPYAYRGFIMSFVVLFLLTGIGNGSTYRMIPMIFRSIHLGDNPGPSPAAEPMLRARRETAAALGFIGAIGAYGGWLIPQSYALSTSITGGAFGALFAFIAFYVSCLGLTWWHYMRSSFAMNWAPSLARSGV